MIAMTRCRAKPAGERTEPRGEAGAARNSTAQRSSLREQLEALEQAGAVELRAEWRRLFGAAPPRLSRDLLVRALAYRVQERASGGLSRASLRQLNIDADENGAAIARASPTPALKPGAKLVREWHGRSHVVSVTNAGFDYAGSTYRSLTEIAKLVTGAHWSGPRFFGLTAGRTVQGASDG